MKNGITILFAQDKMFKRKLAILCIVPLLTGCLTNLYSANLVVTYKSEPTAATLFEGGNNFGYAPVSLTYQLTPAEIKQGYKIVNSTHVRWPSGATAFLEQHAVDLSKGYNQEFTFIRPQGVAGMSEDVQFALEAEKSRMQQEQLNRQAQANFYGQLHQYFQQQQLQKEQIRQRQIQEQLRRPTRCVTHNLGGTLITDCN